MSRFTTRTAVCLAMVLWAAACSAPPDPVSTPQTATAGEPPPAPTPTAANPTPATSPAQPDTTPASGDSTDAPPPSTTIGTVDPPPTTVGTAQTQEPVTTTVPATPPASLRFVKVAEGVRNPIFLTASPGAGHAYLAEQGGRILYMADDRIDDRPVLDITEKVTFRGEQGLLGMAIHPTDPNRLFVHYSDHRGHTVVSEFSLSEDGRSADPESESLVFFTEQPATNHNGGMIQFGPDGHLYLGLGDGGRAGDYYGHGQRPDTPLAALVRIDPDTLASQVWWYGLRNPWRFWIDEPTGLTYIADVGQDAFEEISVSDLTVPDLNFGWPITEGLHCYDPRQGCDTEGLTLPVLEIDHDDRGTCSITGGIVYRGPSMPGLWGHYFYSDYCGGYLRSFRWDGILAQDLKEWAPDLGAVVSFGTDGPGEMYVLTTDTVYRIMADS